MEVPISRVMALEAFQCLKRFGRLMSLPLP
jgi:hypothetical protein